MQRLILVLIVILTELASTMPAFGQATQPLEADPGKQTAENRTLRFDLYQGYLIVVHGTAGPFRHLNLLLDTGSCPTILDPHLAHQLHLRDESAASIVVVGGRAQGSEAILPSLQFGPVRRANLPVVVEDLSFLQPAIPVHIDAMIGLDTLGQSSFLIDYETRTIRFGPAPPMPVSMTLRRIYGGMATVDAQMNHTPIRLLLDTGAGSLFLFKPKASEAAAVAAVRLTTNAIGEFERKALQGLDLELGSAAFAHQPAYLVSQHTEAGLDYEGLVNPVTLGITRVSIDLKQGLLGFAR